MRATFFEALEHLEADIAYIDPPYNQHSYLGNYHVWETLALWDKPEVYGIACKRIDCRERQSIFNSRPRFAEAMRRVIASVKARILIVSFNNEGFLRREEIEEMMSARGQVTVVENEYKRYVGAQIGIYNPQGDKVGEVSHLNNKEYLYVVAPEDTSALSLRFEPNGSQMQLFDLASAEASESICLGRPVGLQSVAGWIAS